MKLYIIIIIIVITKNLIHGLVLKTSETLYQPYAGGAGAVRRRSGGVGKPGVWRVSLSENVIYYGLGWPYKK